jgi:hypothetical protein
MIKTRKLTLTTLLILLFGIFMDISSYQGISLISVSKEYIYYVYTAIVTIAAISATLLTIVVNSFDEKYYGFSIKEIANFRNDYLILSCIIPLVLSLIVLSTLILAIDMINTLVAILITVVFLISTTSKYTWKLISDENFCTDRVSEEINIIVEKNNNKEIESLFKRLFAGLNYSIETYGISSIDKHLNMISNTIVKSKLTEDISILIDKELRDTFKIVSNSIGFIPAIDKVLKLYNSMEQKYSSYDKREIFYKELQDIQFLNDKELNSSSMIEISNGFEDQSYIEDDDKIFILYQYFLNIYFNDIINKGVKNSLLEKLIIHVSEFRYPVENNYDTIKQKTLLYIVRDFILVNKEIEDAKDILISISKVLYSQRNSKSDKLFETIAIIYLAIYLYSEFETETLYKEHRKKLKSLIYEYERNIHTSRISFNLVIKTCFKQIVKALWNLSPQDYKELKFLEYFPPKFIVKTSVWNIDMGVNFAIFNYLLSYYEFGLIPYKMINNWDGIENKKFYIGSMLDFFDYDTQTIKKPNLDKMEEISEWIGIRYSLTLDVQKGMFKNLNEEMERLVDEELEKAVDTVPKIPDINYLLKQRFKDFYGYNESIDVKNSKEMRFRPLIVDLQYCNNELNISERLAGYFESFLNDQIEKELSVVELSFDLDGVKVLLDQLKNNRYNKRNYTYVDDWAFNKEVKESEEYKELVTIIEGISFENTSPIDFHIFFKEGCLDYNIEITEYEHDFLTDDECSVYVENFKVADGLYKLKDAYLNKSKAMEVIMKGYRKELVSFKYKSNLNRDCGFLIRYKYNR